MDFGNEVKKLRLAKEISFDENYARIFNEPTYVKIEDYLELDPWDDLSTDPEYDDDFSDDEYNDD